MGAFLHLLHENLPGYAVILGAQGAILLCSVLLNRTGKVPRELNRKFVHVSGAGVLLAAPALLTSHWAMLVIALGASTILVVTTAFEAFSGLHGVGRGVGGVATYPLAGWIIFYGAFGRGHHDWLAYVIPVLVLATADAMGAIVGTRWGRRRYVVARDHVRSMEGSIVVALVAFIVTLGPVLVSGDIPWQRAILVAIYVGVISSALESVSVLGLDNVLVPFGALVAFQAVRHDSLGHLVVELTSMAAVTALVVQLTRGRISHVGGPVAAAILLFVVIHAGGAAWAVPFGVVLAAWVVYDQLTRVGSKNQQRITSLTTVVTGFGGPTMLLAPWTLMTDEHVRAVLYVAYLTALAVPVGVMWLAMVQAKTFRFHKQVDPIVCTDPANRYRLTPGAVLFAALGVIAVVGAGWSHTASNHSIALAGVCALVGVCAFSLLASRVAHRVTCTTCGSVVLAGLGCCGTPGARDGVAMLDFSLTLALANAASVSLVVVGAMAWNL